MVLRDSVEVMCLLLDVLHKQATKNSILYKAETGSSEKANPRHLEKANLLPKLTVLAKNLFLTNLRVLLSNIAIFFKRLQAKSTKDLVPIWTLHFDEFQGAAFKYNSFFKISA